jgi:hypothetical protein
MVFVPRVNAGTDIFMLFSHQCFQIRECRRRVVGLVMNVQKIAAAKTANS